jgi:DNA-directed RNA polymerase specialized sigma24 family protein
MASDGSITHWLEKLRAGDEVAVHHLWERYFHRLVGLARVKLRGGAGRAADAEDVVLSAIASFCRRAGKGQFPQLLDPDGLWPLLAVLTARKAARLVRDERRLKRGGGKAPVPGAADPDEEGSALAQFLSREPTAEMAAQLAEEYRRLLQRLGDAGLEAIAVARMEGYSVKEVAERFGYAERSVKRKLKLIRGIWEGEVQS